MDAAQFPPGPSHAAQRPLGRCMRQEWSARPQLRRMPGDRRLPLPVPAVPAAAFADPDVGIDR